MTSKDAKIRLYLVEKGYLFPETDAEIEAVENLQKNTTIELPEKLKTPDFILNNLDTPSKRDWSKIFSPNEAKVKSLYDQEFTSMAAREGGEYLPEEIRKQIEEDVRKLEEDE